MDLAHELHDLVRTLDGFAAQMLREFGLTYNQYVALVVIDRHPGITGRDVAQALRISEPSTSALLRRLVGAGYVHDTAPERSGNVRHWSLTDDGQAKRVQCADRLGNSLDANARLIGVDPDELATTIRRLHDEVRTMRGDGPL